MVSNKRNSIMATATGLISSLFNVALSGDVPFANRSSFNACIMFLPRLTFVIHSLFPYRIDDDLQYTHSGFGARFG